VTEPKTTIERSNSRADQAEARAFEIIQSEEQKGKKWKGMKKTRRTKKAPLCENNLPITESQKGNRNLPEDLTNWLPDTTPQIRRVVRVRRGKKLDKEAGAPREQKLEFFKKKY